MGSELTGLRVLYVDDEPDLLEICKYYLESKYKYSVTTETNGHLALSQVRKKCFDAIISDYQMPDMDGIELLKRIRSENNEIPFILFTGRGREEVVIEAINGGADFYLQKGGDPRSQFAELAHYIEAGVRKKRAEIRSMDDEIKFRTFIEQSTDALSIIDNDGKIIEWNRAAEQIFNLEKKNVLGRYFWDIQTMLFVGERLALDNLESRKKSILSALETGKAPFFNKTMKVDINAGNGQIKKVEQVVFPIIAKGSVRIGGISRDVTEKDRAEQLLASERNKLRIGMDLAKLVFWEYDPVKDLFYFDDRFYDLYGTNSVCENGHCMSYLNYIREFVHPDDVERIMAEVKEVVEDPNSRSPHTYLHRVVTREGEVREILVKAVTVRDEGGRLVRSYGVNQDITGSIAALGDPKD